MPLEHNPNHQVTQQVREHWHKFCAILLHKQGLNEVVITMGDITSLPDGLNIAVLELPDGIHLRLIGAAETATLLQTEGGRPH